MPPRWPFPHIFRRWKLSLTDSEQWARNSIRVAQFALVYHVSATYIGGVRPATGISMVPTMPSSLCLLMYSSLHRRGRYLAVGDIISYNIPHSRNELACKRVIGLPGDFVSVITPPRPEEEAETLDVDEKWARIREEVIRVPEGHCWVAGDNLEWSRDSRLCGPVPLALVRGKIIAVLWPWEYMKWVGAETDFQQVGEGSREWVRGE